MDLSKYDLTPRETGLVERLDASMKARGHDPSLITHADREGEPISMGLWAVLFERESYRVFLATVIGDGILVTTIWLGVPMVGLYETAVRVENDEHSGRFPEMQRWHSMAEARAGHAVIVGDLSAQAPGVQVRELV